MTRRAQVPNPETTPSRTAPRPPFPPAQLRGARSGLRLWWRADGGSVAAEVTIAVPFLIMLLLVVAVVIHRGVAARIRVDDAAHQAARAASIERSTSAASTAALTTAYDALAQAGPACAAVSVETVTAGLRPGGTVAVTVSCQVDFGDALILGVPGGKTISATAVEPVDRYRSTAAGAPVPTGALPAAGGAVTGIGAPI